MKERPILFSAPEVRAILEGRKTQTRRIVKPMSAKQARWLTPEVLAKVKRVEVGNWDCGFGVSLEHFISFPFGAPGDRLWVREPFVYRHKHDRFYYRADHPKFDPYAHDGWKSAVAMPRQASRITLEVTDVRVERLQDISEADARAEGARPADASVMFEGCGHWHDTVDDARNCPGSKRRRDLENTARGAFVLLWNKLNNSASWPANPWVWVINFKRITKEQHT